MGKFPFLILLAWAVGATSAALYFRAARDEILSHEKPQKECGTQTQSEGQTLESGISLQLKPQEALHRERADAAPHASPRSNSRSVAEWMSAERLKEVTQQVSLSTEETESLKEALGAQEIFDLDTAAARQAITETIGTERAAAFYSRRAELQHREEQERLETEVLSFSRMLNLSQEQEGSLRRVLSDVTERTQEVMRSYHLKRDEVTARHNDPLGDRGALRRSYQEMKSALDDAQALRSDLLRSKLRGLLSEEQYNAYLAHDANNSASEEALP